MSDVESEGTPLQSKREKREALMAERKKKASRKEEGIFGRLGAICCSLITSLVLLILFNMLSIAGIIIGSLYLDPSFCPGQPHLAATVIASGALAIILSIFEGRMRVKSAREDEDEDEKDLAYGLLNLLRLAKLCLFIYLCVLVFSLYSVLEVKPSGVHSAGATIALEPEIAGSTNGTATAAAVTASHYCHPTLFFFAFWTILIVLVFLAASLLLACCICCIAALFATSD